ncbi:hypothetical protein H6G25_05365 [Dolichospermum sp. FACHB-1091]|uniref:hypothetical protein n=1 Tax=Dolichospermum sp. FACHB-1091 TaxID=2692798 RepID=UPI001680F5A8|nr:hypothetical protein [Dolichospermum sp. FACHB-1091]MBD2442640.1 hypothetical protein [Dolichospermum sp. FACHB-1091]
MIKINISTPPIIAKTLAVSGFAASVLLAATPAHAISFNFSFQDTDGGTNGFVTGTLIGLEEGDNPGSGITATVTSSPGGEGVGSGYSFSSTNGSGLAFTVINGNITFANAGFINPINPPFAYALLLGTTGNKGSNNLLTDLATFAYADSANSTIQFTAATPTPVPFEPNPAVGGAILGFCFGAAKLRRNHLAKKRMVSVEA